MKKRMLKDGVLNGFTYLFSCFGVVILIFILYFIFSKGVSLLSVDILKGNYYGKSYTLKYTDTYQGSFEYVCKDGEFFSKKWGVAFLDKKNLEGEEDVAIGYVAPTSPFNQMIDVGTNTYVSIQEGQWLNKGVLVGTDDTIITIVKKDNADTIAQKLDQAKCITNLSISADGGGIKGSLIATLLLIGITLCIALPIGICAAIYFSIYAKKNKVTQILEAMIDMTGGIPSIIFGLVGVIVFIPILNRIIATDGVSIMAGALTLSILLLPIVIKTTKEAIDVIPKSFSEASLALGASQTQTTLKIILPNAISGILTSALLCIGRIIGESAALIFVIGSQVSDTVSIHHGATTLATHIWNLLSGESPNYALACAISIVILIVVCILNTIVKLIGKKLHQFER